MFFVTHKDLMHLSGRSKQALYGMRNQNRIPFEKLEDGALVYDIDDPKIVTMINDMPPNWPRAQIDAVRAFQKEFTARRRSQRVACAKTGDFDYMAEMEPGDENAFAPSMDEEALNLRKKEVEIDHKLKQIEKIDITLSALTGDLIDRVYVESYIRRYLGALHQQVLDLASTGIMDDLYNMFMREKDGTKAIKDGEKLLEKRMSQLLKDSTASMKSNPI